MLRRLVGLLIALVAALLSTHSPVVADASTAPYAIYTSSGAPECAALTADGSERGPPAQNLGDTTYAAAGLWSRGASACSDGPTKPIRNVKIGDRVKATNPKTGKTYNRRVTYTWIHSDHLTKARLGHQTITTTRDHKFYNATTHRWQHIGSFRTGDHTRGLNGQPGLTYRGFQHHTTRVDVAYNLTVARTHTYYIGHHPLLVHNCGGATNAVDVAASRVKLRVGTKAKIQDSAPKTASGDFIDPNTGQIIPRSGPFHYGHKPGFEWWRTQQLARQEGWTREQVIEFENDWTRYQIEDPLSNMSHLFEMPR